MAPTGPGRVCPCWSHATSLDGAVGQHLSPKRRPRLASPHHAAGVGARLAPSPAAVLEPRTSSRRGSCPSRNPLRPKAAVASASSRSFPSCCPMGAGCSAAGQSRRR